MSTVNFIIWQTFYIFTLSSTKSPTAIQSIWHRNSNHPPHLSFLYYEASTYHIYTTPQLFRPFHTIYRKLFYSAKLTNHIPLLFQPSLSQPTASKLKSFSSATFAGPLEKLSPGKSALFADHSLSEPLRGEFELSANAFSRFSGA